jgi:hypothetical protein
MIVAIVAATIVDVDIVLVVMHVKHVYQMMIMHVVYY